MGRIRKELLEIAIKNKLGLVSHIARGLGVSRKSVYRAIERYHLQDLLVEVRETALDVAEYHLINAIKDGNARAIIFYLKTIGKSRGYGKTENIKDNSLKIIGY